MNVEQKGFFPEEEVLREVRTYSDTIKRQPEYQAVLIELDGLNKPTVELYLDDGVRSSIRVINILQRLANPETKEKLLKQLDNGEVPDGWIEELVMRDMSDDPYGLNALESMKRLNMKFVEKKIKRDTDPVQGQHLAFHAHVVEQGADLVINKYRKQLEMYGYIASE